MTEDLDAIKSDFGVLRVYSPYVSLKKTADRWSGMCPVHKEKSPSFTVYPDMRFNCFGCGISGNIFQFVQKMDGCDFKTAVEKVKSEIGGWDQVKAKVDATFKPVAEAKTYKTIPISAWKKFEDALESNLTVINYLQEQRGISLKTAQKLHIGYVQNIGSLALAEGRDIADKGWLAFPSIEGDKIVSVKYRSLIRKKPGGFCKQIGMKTCLFNTETIDPFEAVYLTEGEFDTAVLEQAGFHAVSLASGSSHPTPEQKDLLMRASQVILAGDNDGGVGNKIMGKLWREMQERTYLLTWPDGCKDANELYLRDPSSFRTTVEDLTHKARLQPMPSVYNLTEVLLSGEDAGLADRPDRLRFPHPTADKMLVILPGHVLGLGATNTGMGKTMYEVQLSLHNAVKYGRSVLNFQAEMSPAEIAVLVAAQTLKKHRNLLTKEDMAAVAGILSRIEYYVGRDPNLTQLDEVLDLLEAAIRRLSPDITILDHFHHFSAGVHNENQIQAAAATRIKQMAETYGTIFINVGQPRKANQQAKGKKIHITDFKGSGAWGDAANAVLVIHRDLNKMDDVENSKGPYEDKTLLQVLKGRSLGMGASACYLTCFGEYGCFEEIEHNYEGESE